MPQSIIDSDGADLLALMQDLADAASLRAEALRSNPLAAAAATEEEVRMRYLHGRAAALLGSIERALAAPDGAPGG